MTELESVKKLIEENEVISFDVFDTLLMRTEDRPLAVFELLEQNLHIKNFASIRPALQNKASEKLISKNYPHANMAEIYEEIKESLQIDPKEIMEKEIELEKKTLYANREMKEIFEYAKKKKKRIIITTDMYLSKKTIEQFLKENGYTGFAKIYDSADERCAKFNKTLFEQVIKKENVSPNKILHIGDNEKDDIVNAKECGINTYHYVSKINLPKSKKGDFLSSWALGMTKKMIQEKKLDPNNFWQILGFRIAGPMYLRLYDFIIQNQRKNANFFFLGRDGYNLYELNKRYKKINGTYLYASRRALLLAGIEKINEETMSNLPPFTFGQTAKEILEYLDFSLTEKELAKIGLKSTTVIKTEEDRKKFKNIYLEYKEKFLKHCQKEKEYALKYLKEIGLLEKDAVIFDCGWHGSSQYLFQEFLKKNGYKHQLKFCYTGIQNSEKSTKQLKGLEYETCFFDIDTSSSKVEEILKSVVLAELFFGAPEGSVWKYDKAGYVLENLETDFEYKKEILEGIKLFYEEGNTYYQTYLKEVANIEFLNPLYELITNPTKEEATKIGNIKNVDGFASKKNKPTYIANLKKEDILENPYTEIYWVQGLLVREDIENAVKHYAMGEDIQRCKRILKKTYLYKGYKKMREIMYTEGLRAYAFRKTNGLKRRLTSQGNDYDRWIKYNEKKDFNYEANFSYHPKISIVVPVYNVLTEQLEACIMSVFNQTYKNYELIMIDDASTMKTVRETLKKYENTPKIVIDYHEKNEQISKTTNDCIARAQGEFIAFLDCDDVLAPNALEEVVRLLNKDKTIDFIYSDEDKLTENGSKRHSPFFKPDWSKDTFLSLMYTCHFSVYRKTIVDKIGGLTVGLDGAQDYDFTLRFQEETQKIAHIPKILYHWRERKESIASNPEAKPYALKAIKELKERYLKSHHLEGFVEYDTDVFQYRIVYKEKKNSLVSIIILSKDHPKVLEICVKSIREKTEYQNYEILVIDNGSEKKNKKEYERLSKIYQFSYFHEPLTFNFSKMCNIGAKESKGDFYLFLNDDVEVITPSWIDRMVGACALPHTGAVGAKLYYPNSSILQHDGIVNLRHGPSHVLMGMDDEKLYYYCNNRLDYNYLAVTGACLMIEKKKFDQIEGFDELLPVAYNDVDLCFKLYEKGYQNVVRNDVKLYHYESLSRGNDIINIEKINRLRKEKKYLYLKHPHFLGYDPYYNPNLDQTSIDFKIDTTRKEKTKVKVADSFEVSKSEFIHSLEKLSIVENHLKIYGYALLENFSKNNQNKISILLKSRSNQYEIPAKKLYRSDIAFIYKLHCHLSGFYVNSELSNVQKGTYEVYIKLENKKHHLKQINNTDFVVEVKNEKNNK